MRIRPADQKAAQPPGDGAGSSDPRAQDMEDMLILLPLAAGSCGSRNKKPSN
jgi:hypothetical protein